MEQSGLVSRQRSVEDERRVEVSLTPDGKTLKTRAASVPACVVEAAGCPIPELMTLTHDVQSLRKKLAGA
jgi:DNA-binding MarR family transcriptional regulator